MQRGKDDINKLLERYDKTKFIVVDDFEYIDVCSTNIRNGIYKNIDDRVKNYIITNNLYK